MIATDSAARVILHKGRARPLWYGHPWVYANAIARVDGQAEPGDAVLLCDHDGRVIGRGHHNPRSQIAVRLLSRKDEPVDTAFFARKLAAAKAVRDALGLPSERTDAYRLVNSEGDGLPGLVIDVFGDAASVQVSTLGMARCREQVLDALAGVLPVRTVFESAVAGYAEVEGFAPGSRIARGESRPSVACREDAIALEVEPLVGQKTGMFVDQRETRIRVGALSRGRRVLDLYAFAGGFSLQAARGGASQVVAVDTSARAVARIEAHAAANGMSERISAVEADAFRFLESATPQSFDLLVVDPPKFARARKDLEAARKGYERLNALALTAAAPGALMITCSCSQNVDAEELERIVSAAAKATGRAVRVLDRGGAGPDHPLPPAFPEGRYLKVLYLFVE